MALFVDTSALLKAYVVERRGSDVMREILTRSEFEAGIFVSSTVILETYGCIARKWRRKIIDDGEFRTAWEELRRDVDTRLLGVVEHSPDLIDRATVLAAAHRDIDAGGIDCLHMASAERLAAVLPSCNLPTVFVAVDRGLRTLASRRGFNTFDPETQTVPELLRAAPPGLDLPYD